MKRKTKFIWGAILGIVLIGGAVAWFIFTQKFDDTSKVKADYILSADSLLSELSGGTNAVNKKYTEKILDISGKVSEIESLDSMVNVKFTDTLNGNYLIFSFQDKDVPEANKLTEGEQVAVRGSCSGAVHSDILELDYISFKRSAIIKNKNNQNEKN